MKRDRADHSSLRSASFRRNPDGVNAVLLNDINAASQGHQRFAASLLLRGLIARAAANNCSKLLRYKARKSRWCGRPDSNRHGVGFGGPIQCLRLAPNVVSIQSL